MFTTATQELVWVLFQTKKMIARHPTLSLDLEFIGEARETSRAMLHPHIIRQTTEERISKSWDIFWSVEISGLYQRYDLIILIYQQEFVLKLVPYNHMTCFCLHNNSKYI